MLEINNWDQDIRRHHNSPRFLHYNNHLHPIDIPHYCWSRHNNHHLHPRLQDHTGSSCGRAYHTTTIFLPVVLSHNHNHNIFYMFWRTNIWWVFPSIVMWGLFLKQRENCMPERELTNTPSSKYQQKIKLVLLEIKLPEQNYFKNQFQIFRNKGVFCLLG